MSTKLYVKSSTETLQIETSTNDNKDGSCQSVFSTKFGLPFLSKPLLCSWTKILKKKGTRLTIVEKCFPWKEKTRKMTTKRGKKERKSQRETRERRKNGCNQIRTKKMISKKKQRKLKKTNSFFCVCNHKIVPFFPIFSFFFRTTAKKLLW